MKTLLQVTLVRRVVFALLIAFGIAWIALMAQTISQSVDEQRESDKLSQFQASVMGNLRQLARPDLAQAYLSGAVDETNRPYAGTRKATIAARLVDARGQVVFAHLPPGDDLMRAINQAQAGPMTTRHGYLVLREDSGPWSLTVATHRHNMVAVVMDDWLELSSDMLLVFPFILIPVWIAVSRGLRPLRLLSQHIAGKGDDLSPLGFDPKYAELKPLAMAVDGLLSQLRGKIQRERAFVQDAAHELRTPIAVISAQAHVLSRAADAQARLEAASRMDHAVARAAHLIQQLLHLAEADADSAQKNAIVDVADLVRGSLAQLGPNAVARSMDLRLEAPDALPWPLNPTAFQSVLHNLLDNAIKYAHGGGNIVVTLCQMDNTLAISVADDGPGIAEHDLPHLFERFYRGQGQDVAGAGLGLAIVKQASASLGGEIQMGPGLGGGGVRFTLTLTG